MNRFLLLFLVALFFSCNSDDSMDGAEKIYTLIPDERFERILIDQDFDSDQTVNGQISYADAKKITDLTFVLDIVEDINLEGIQDFINLKSFYMYGGAIDNLDLDSNTNLTDLRLEGLRIDNNLILPLKSSLKNLTIRYSGVKLINLRDNDELDSLTIISDAVENLSIGNSVKLRSLSISSNSNNFTALDISNNTLLERVDLSVKNLTAIDISNLTKLNDLDIIDNPKLVCAKIFEGQDISNYNYGYHTTFTTNCSNLPVKEYTQIPNAFFEQILIDNNIDTEDELDGKVLTKSLENATSLYLYAGGRESNDDGTLEGLEKLENLEWIFFNYLNKLKIDEYDFSQNPKLAFFKLVGYEGSGPGRRTFDIDLSQLTNLETLHLSNANFNTTNLSQCQQLKTVEFLDINAMDYDFTTNPTLEQINVENANSIDLTACLNLKELEIESTVISNLNLSNNLNLESITLNKLPITSLVISDKPQLIDLVLKNLNSLTTPDIKNNTNLKTYHIESCSLVQEIDVSLNTGLERLLVFDNQSINTINVEQNTNLKDLVVVSTSVGNLDLTNNNLLRWLSIKNNPITSIDISNNLLLRSLYVQESEIANLDITNHSNLKYLIVRNTNISNLDLADKKTSNCFF